MSPSICLSSFLLLALAASRVSALVPDNAPDCAKTCARIKVSEGYCSSAAVFATAYVQCLRDNCNATEVDTSNGFTNTICTAAPTPAVNGTPTTTPANTSSVSNGTDFASTVANALRAAGLGSLAGVVSSPAAAGFVSRLQQGNRTVLAPSDSALASIPLNSTSPQDLNAFLDYHVLPGTLNVAALPSNPRSIVRTSLKGAPYTNLPGNDSQVLVLASSGPGSVAVIEPTRNITLGNGTQVGNLEISVIPSALTIPGTIASTAAGVPDLSNLVAAIRGGAPQLFDQLDQTPGITIFAPINSALSGQVPNLQAVLWNHIVNGTVLYSTVLGNISSVTSAGGAIISFPTNASGTYAQSGDRSVQIVQADIITRNGVIHLVNGLFGASNSTPTLPLPNQNNTASNAGITAIDGSGRPGNAQNGAQNSTGSTLLPSFNIFFTPVFSVLLGAFHIFTL